MKKLLYCVLCASMCLFHTACCDDNDVNYIPDDKEEQPDVPKEHPSSASLTYEMSCDSDLVAFVTPEITYTDSLGKHSVLLEGDKMKATRYALCHKMEGNKVTYTSLEVDNDGLVPDPWIVDYYYTRLKWSEEVHLNQVGVVNECTMKFRRKDDYVIDSDKEYRMSYRLYCDGGHSSTYIDGQLILNIYTNTDIIIGSSERTLWMGHELEAHLDELCEKTITVTMMIDEKGGITKVSK